LTAKKNFALLIHLYQQINDAKLLYKNTCVYEIVTIFFSNFRQPYTITKSNYNVL